MKRLSLGLEAKASWAKASINCSNNRSAETNTFGGSNIPVTPA